MSHWKKSKMALVSTVQVLKRALINIVPDWEGHIQIDEGSGLTIVDMGGKAEGGVALKIKKNAPGCRWCDLGFRKASDGTWEMIVDPDGIPRELGGRNATNLITREVSAMRTKYNAEAQGHIVLEEKRQGKKIIQRILVKV